MRPSPFSLTPWVRGLIIANAVVYLLRITVFTGPWVEELFAFSPDAALRRWWGFFTYMFLHRGFLHLAVNMLGLFVFGRAVEERMGGSAFGVFYVFCGLGGAILSFTLTLFAPVAPFVGASGAVLGVAVAFAMHWPDAPIHVFPFPVPIKAKWLVTVFAGLDLLAAVAGASDGVAHLAHLGGLLFGFLYVTGERALMRRARSAMRRTSTRVLPFPREREAPAAAPEPRPRAPAQAADDVDRVLDKISASGIESLTPEERRLLDDASRQLREP